MASAQAHDVHLRWLTRMCRKYQLQISKHARHAVIVWERTFETHVKESIVRHLYYQ